MKQVTKKTDISLKSRHFAHKGSSSQGFKQTESSQDLKTQVSQDAKSSSVHGSLPLGKDFSDEKKLVMQQMASKEKQKDDNAPVVSITADNESSENTEGSSAASNAEMSKASGSSGNPPFPVKPAVYSSAEIKPRNSTLQGASVNLSRTGVQTEERTNVAQSDNSSIVEEDSKTKAKSGAAAAHTSHIVAANYSFFPGSEESEVDQPKNAKVNKLFPPNNV